RVKQLKQETYALYLAYKDPRVSWYARVWLAIVIGYAFSPIDLIPDFIPILGYLDDLILIPAGIWLALKLIPPPVLVECRARAKTELMQGGSIGQKAAVAIIVIWIVLAGSLVALFVTSGR
ncbi:MAG: DUF1232 domain-containing protein, partial [Anaerolineales bacterium]|nr:DUF1232 domain-containing protein [Anaerolineales bacterium]